MREPISATWVPEACTLPTAEQPLRVVEFESLFAASRLRVERITPFHGRVILDASATDAARDLAARENACCSFFQFEFSDTDEGIVMNVSVPAGHAEVLEGMLHTAETAGHG